MTPAQKEKLRQAIDKLEKAAEDYGYYNDDVGPAFDMRVKRRAQAWKRINKILESK